MTEERIKELAKSYEGNIATCLSRKDWNGVHAVLEDLICTVATEAREEARKEGIDELRDALLEDWEGFVYEDDIKAKAECLKEKGR